MILALDFDGTVVENRYPEVGAVLPGCISWLRLLQASGVRIILWTMRSGEQLAEATDLLVEAGIELWAVNGNPAQGSWTSSPKAHADVYVDDRALGVPTVLDAEGKSCVDWGLAGPMLAAMALSWGVHCDLSPE